MKKVIGTFLLMWVAVIGYSQSIQTASLAWQVTDYKDLRTDSITQKASSFESRPGSITWIQKGGAHIYEFNVTGVSGSWDNVTTTGEFTFQVQFRSYSGSIRFLRTTTGLRIEPDVQKNGINLFPYSFNCSTVAPTQP